jgi:hypothetical protein
MKVHHQAVFSILLPLLLLRSKYSPLLKHSVYASPFCERPFKTTGKIVILYILFFVLLESGQEDKGL